jgi:KAP family P-loop domain
VALLHEIRSHFTSIIKFRSEATKILEVGIIGALHSIEDCTKKLGFQASKIAKAGKDWEEEHLASALPSETFHKLLTQAISTLLKHPANKNGNTENRRLIIIIDDLDRCEPAVAYKLLEGIKLYLSLENCVFILGMNQEVVEEAIGSVIPGADEAAKKERACAYLEKLCLNIWRVPVVKDPLAYLTSLCVEEHRTAIEKALQGISCLPPNPRRIKGVANLMNRLWDRLPEKHSSADVQCLVVVALVHQFHHDIYRRWHAHPELTDTIVQWCTDPTQDIGQVGNLFSRLKPIATFKSGGADESAPTETIAQTEVNAFADPSDTNVFWAQMLVVGLVKELQTVGSRPTSKMFTGYLDGMK